MTNIIAIRADGSEYPLQPLKDLVTFMVTVILDPLKRPIRINATASSHEYVIPTLFYFWAKNVKMLELVMEQAGQKRSISHRIELIKELRAQLHIGLFEAKHLANLLIDHESKIDDQPAQVRMCCYAEEELSFKEIEARVEEFK